MSYPTLRPEYWREQERQQQARDARIGRTGTEAERRYCNARRVRWWGIIAFTMWLTYALRKLDASGLWLLVGILVLTPLLVIVVGEWLKCWYDRKIDVIESGLLATEAQSRDLAEQARKERMRAEMARSIMSGLRDEAEEDREVATPPTENTFMGGEIMLGEVLGEIVGGAVAVSPLPAVHPSLERSAERVPTGQVIEPGDWRLALPRCGDTETAI